MISTKMCKMLWPTSPLWCPSVTLHFWRIGR